MAGVRRRWPATPAGLAGWRGLARFWVGILVLCGIGGAILQILGEPGAADRPLPPATSQTVRSAANKTVESGFDRSRPDQGITTEAGKPGRDVPGPLSDPIRR